ncbi:hypothetical protein ACN4DT_03210 [Corynebacterium macclintockiae]|uniref:hypothetical protein n=1 Tax=Corynebacterium macclintockiae TaxID=2913501 RepID=UPI003EBEADAF
MNSEQRLEELKRRAKELAERIGKLEDQLNNAQPTTGLLGRWAINRHGKQVLITADRPVGGWIETAYVSPDGATSEKVEEFARLTFPDQTTRPEDVPVGEAWLVDADAGDASTTNTPAVKESTGLWITGENNEGGVRAWSDNEVTLITPLIPARPQDTPETVTTEDEYAALPEGSVVAKPGFQPWTQRGYTWIYRDHSRSTAEMAGTTRHVLRWGR